uniref:Ig-like domain-containing protein n=1 Tax=Oryzias sinensis TaxID=183150 RepID=A0A8C7YL94_9TELE
MTQKPFFTQPITSCVVPHGEVARFHARVSSMPKPEISWFHNRQPVFPSKNVVFHFDEVTSTATLIIVDAFDSGSYRVMAINSEGSAESTASLLVSLREEQSAPPHVVQELENIACPEGSTAELKCTISGEPAPEVAWYFEDTCLKVVGGKYGVRVEGKVYRLYISNFTHTDAGLYKCIGRNKLGEVSSCASVSCQVEKPVTFSKSYETVVSEGITASQFVEKVQESAELV